MFSLHHTGAKRPRRFGNTPDEPARGNPQQTERASARTFLLDGAHWRVFEMIRWGSDPAKPSLIFESDGAVRMVSNFPADWRDLSDRALLAVSWHR